MKNAQCTPEELIILDPSAQILNAVIGFKLGLATAMEIIFKGVPDCMSQMTMYGSGF